MEDKSFDNDNYGAMFSDPDAKILRKGTFHLDGKKYYGMVIEKKNNEGQTQYEMLVSMGLLHYNAPENKKSEASPDMGGKVTMPLVRNDDFKRYMSDLEALGEENEDVRKVYDGLAKYDVPLIYKLGIWAKESAAGRPYSSLGFELVDDVAETNVEPEQPVDDFKPKF